MVDCKRLIKHGLMSSGLLSLAQRLKGPRTVILRYHSVKDAPDDYTHSIGRGIVHSTADFTEQMEWLARTYEPVGLDDLAASLAGGRPMPARGVLITFDDGYADNLEIAAPVLNRLGLKAAFYITVDSIVSRKMPWFCRLRHAFDATHREFWQDPVEGRAWRMDDAGERRQAFLTASGGCARKAGQHQDELIDGIERGLAVETLAPRERLMMDWNQIRELRDQGHVVGSHTLTHPNLAQVSREEASWEIGESKRMLEEALGAPIHHFSYPSPILQPHWSEATKAACQQYSYQTAVTCTPGPVRAGDAPLSLKRIAAPEKLDDFQWAVRCAFLGRCV